jgi:hypothetical protein
VPLSHGQFDHLLGQAGAHQGDQLGDGGAAGEHDAAAIAEHGEELLGCWAKGSSMLYL